MSKCDRFFDVFKNAEYDLYPIVIMQSRYGGTYEGGKWIAIGNFSSIQDAGLSDYVSGDDGDAVDFWSSDRNPNGKSRKSITFKGVAEAMADQWG